MSQKTESRQAAWAGFEAEALPHLASLFLIAMWFERNRQEAEDLVQETMKQALESFHRYTCLSLARLASSFAGRGRLPWSCLRCSR